MGFCEDAHDGTGLCLCADGGGVRFDRESNCWQQGGDESGEAHFGEWLESQMLMGDINWNVKILRG